MISARRLGRKRLDAFVASIPGVPASELRILFAWDEPFSYKPHTENLADLRMELDDAQVLRYLFRNARPRRHLEFGTWEGRSALACLEECDATVWTINLLEGERGADGSVAYGRTYLGDQQKNLDGAYDVIGTDDEHGGIVRSYQTDGYGFIGRFIRDAGLSHRVCQIYADSREWDVSPFPDGFFDTVLVDGGHDPDTVINDTRKALLRLRPGGLIVWHDFCPEADLYCTPGTSCHGVVSGLTQIWHEVDAQLTEYRWVEGTWLLVGMRAGVPAAARGRKAKNSVLSTAPPPLSEADALAKFHREREALNDALLRVRSEKASLEKKLAEFNAVVRERDLLATRNVDLTKLARDRDQILAQRDALAKKQAERQAEVAALKERIGGLVRYSDERDALSRKAEQATAERNRVQAELADVRIGLDARDDRLARLEAQKRDHDQTLAALRQEKSGLAAAIAGRERDIEALEARTLQLSEELAARTRELDAQNEVMRGHNRQSEAQAADKAALEEAYKMLEESRAALQDSDDALQRERADKEAQLQQARGEATLRARENTALEARVAALGQTVAQLQATRGELEAALAERAGEVAAQTSEIAERERAIAEMGREMAALRETMSGELDQARSAMAQLQQSRQGLAADLARQRSELGELAARLEHRSAQLAETGARVAVLAAERDRMQRRLIEIGRALRGTEAENRALNSEKAEIASDHERRNREVAALTGERDGLLGDIERHRRSLAHFDRVMSDIRRENENLRAAVDDYATSHSWRITAPLRMVTSLFRR